MALNHSNMQTNTNVYYLNDFHRKQAYTVHAPLLPRNRDNDEYETPKETAIRFALLSVIVAFVMVVAYQT